MSSTRVPITGDGSAIISSSLDVELVGVGDVPLELYYDIKGTVEFVRTHGYHKVALQFPDDLLRDAPAVVQALHAGVPDAQFFVLGDTSYGSCCVDEVAAAHASVEAIVHYGPACLSPYVGGSGDGGGGPAPAWLCVCVRARASARARSVGSPHSLAADQVRWCDRTQRLPVYYVFGQRPCDAAALREQVLSLASQSPVLVFYDVTLHETVESVRRALDAGSGAAHAIIIASLNRVQLLSSAEYARGTVPVLSDQTLGVPGDAAASPAVSEVVDTREADGGEPAVVVRFAGETCTLPPSVSLADCALVYVGAPESRAVVNLVMSFPQHKVCPWSEIGRPPFFALLLFFVRSFPGDLTDTLEPPFAACRWSALIPPAARCRSNRCRPIAC